MSTTYHTAPRISATPDWMKEIAELLPSAYQEKAKEMKAFVRVRKIGTVDDLLRAMLCWGFARMSLRQLGIWGTLQQVGSLSDRAWSKRLTTTHTWVLWLVGQLLLTAPPPPVCMQRRLRVVDASNLRARQAKSSLLRLHTSYLLNEQRIDEIAVTTESAAESFAHLTWQAGDIVIADRGYCRRTQIAHIRRAHADLIVRWHSTSVPLFTAHGVPFNVVEWLTNMPGAQDECVVSDGTHSLRFIACRLSPQAAERARKKCLRKAQKNGCQLQPATVFFAGWFVLLTSLASDEATLSQILELYRARWQVELLFKRIKQLLTIHRLPSFREHANKALMGILLCGWILLETYRRRLMAMTPTNACSLWQCQSLLVRTFQQQILGTWSLSLIMASWPDLQRYLRLSRPPQKCWSCETLLASIDSLLSFA